MANVISGVNVVIILKASRSVVMLCFESVAK